MKKSISVASARTKELDDATRAAIIAVCIAAHDNQDFQRLFSFLPPDGLHVLGCMDARLVSHAVVTTRWLQPAGYPLLRTAYVDAVSTDPAVQGQGFGSAVMQKFADLVAGDYDIACLETERTSFYARLGWQEWRGALAGRTERGLAPTPDQSGIMILPLPRTPALDLDSLLTIECQTDRIW